MEAERELALLARRVPAEGDPEGERRTLVGMAEASELVEVEIQPGAAGEGALSKRLAELGARWSAHEISARGDLVSVAAFLHRRQFLPRPNVVESFEIVPSGPGEVRLSARLVFPSLEPFAVGLEATRELVALGDRPATALFALGELAYRIDSHPIALTRFRHDFPDAVALDALVAGTRTPAELESALAASGIAPASIVPRPIGGCIALATAGQAPTPEGAPPSSEIPDLPYEDFGYEVFVAVDSSLCDPRPAQRATRVERRGVSGASAVGGTLRARDVDRTEALTLLGRATGRPMLAYGGGEPRFDFELHDVGAEETLSALEGAGVRIVRYAEAVLWTDAVPARPPDLPYQGFPVSLDFRCAELVDILRLFGEVSGLEFRPAPELSGCVSLRVMERPWDEALDALLAVAGVDRRIDGATVEVFFPPAPGPRPALPPAPARLDARKWRLPMDRLSIDDLRLVALLRPEPGAAWVAYARGPLGERYELQPGDALADARVEAVDGDGVTLAAPGRTIRADLP